MSRVVILGASGGVGRELVRQTLDRGDDVIAASWHPDGLVPSGSGNLQLAAVDVLDFAAANGAMQGADIVFSALGVSKGDNPGGLAAGARAIANAASHTVVSVGAMGTGPARMTTTRRS